MNIIIREVEVREVIRAVAQAVSGSHIDCTKPSGVRVMVDHLLIPAWHYLPVFGRVCKTDPPPENDIVSHFLNVPELEPPKELPRRIGIVASGSDSQSLQVYLRSKWDGCNIISAERESHYLLVEFQEVLDKKKFEPLNNLNKLDGITSRHFGLHYPITWWAKKPIRVEHVGWRHGDRKLEIIAWWLKRGIEEFVKGLPAVNRLQKAASRPNEIRYGYGSIREAWAMRCMEDSGRTPSKTEVTTNLEKVLTPYERTLPREREEKDR